MKVRRPGSKSERVRSFIFLLSACMVSLAVLIHNYAQEIMDERDEIELMDSKKLVKP